MNRTAPNLERLFSTTTWKATMVWSLLGLSLLAVGLAPALMPDSYSVVEHSVSESAAQGVEGAWLARMGFLLLGGGVLLCAQLAFDRWGLWARVAHRIYGLSMLTVAAFSHRPWLDVPFDAFEDLLHSVGASTVGFGFTVGVALVAIRRDRGVAARVFDGAALVAAVAIPMVMMNVDGVAGAVQRAMFLVGYLWYSAEAWRSVQGSS